MYYVHGYNTKIKLRVHDFSYALKVYPRPRYVLYLPNKEITYTITRDYELEMHCQTIEEKYDPTLDIYRGWFK